MKLVTWLALAGALAQPLSAQNTWYVDDDNCPGPGSGSFVDPFCSVQRAINSAENGDTVLVGPGTYQEPFGIPIADFSGKDITLRSTHGPAQTVFLFGSPAVLFAGGETRAAVLEGFSISSGYPTGVRVIGASPTLRGNVIQNNLGDDGGAGIKITGGGEPLVVENQITGNVGVPTRADGVGILIQGADALLLRNEITNNRGSADYGGCHGGGVYARDSNLTAIGNLIAGNRLGDESWNSGGGLYAKDSTVLLVGNTFTGNLAADGDPFLFGSPGAGGAVFFENSQVTIQDSSLWDDTASIGPEIATVGGTLTISYSNLAGGPAAAAGTGALNVGAGMLDTDPMAVGNRLLPGSPLIDAGSLAAANAEPVDADMEPRVLDGDLDGVQRIDIGWDEYDVTTLSVSGTPTPGGSLTFDTGAPAGWFYLLGYASGTGAIVRAPFGSLLLDPGSVRLFDLGFVPGSRTVNLPPDPELRGRDLWTQALAKAPGIRLGSYSARVRIAIR